MIIARSPLRITLGGGGTDVPSYYRDHGGFLVAAAIDRYVYITLHNTFSADLIVKYSKLERVTALEGLEHPLIREAFTLLGQAPAYLEITSMADIPAGTGLGSSGSFTTGLLKALHTHRKTPILPAALAEQACDIEINRLGEPVGKQDQYIAAHGGVTCFRFNTDDSVDVSPLAVSRDTLYDLEDTLMMFFTGFSRKAGDILRDQDTRTKCADQAMIDNLHFVKQLGFESEAALIKGDLAEFGRLMDVHWQHKKKRSGGMSNPRIDECYEFARRHGATGGKLIGAGGGGFLLFHAADKTRLRAAMHETGLQEVRFRFDFEGTKVIVQ